MPSNYLTVEYGSFIMNVNNETIKDKIVKIQVKALRKIMGYRMSTPKNVILAESKEPPTYIRAKYLACNFLIRALSLQGHPLKDILEDIDNTVFRTN